VVVLGVLVGYRWVVWRCLGVGGWVGRGGGGLARGRASWVRDGFGLGGGAGMGDGSGSGLGRWFWLVLVGVSE